MDQELPIAIAAVQRALDDTEAEYARMPFFVRPMVRRGFVRRTGHDFAGWRELLARAARGELDPSLGAALAALAEHYRGAPERARRGMGASRAELAIVEQRCRDRAEAASRLALALEERDRSRSSSSDRAP